MAIAAHWQRRHWLAALLLGPCLALAEPGPRLEILVSAPTGEAGPSGCAQARARRETPPQLILTDADVHQWQKESGKLRLNAERQGLRLHPQLTENCFHLYADGRLLTHGILLPHDSPWLSGIPTFNIQEREGQLELQLTTSNHRGMALMLVNELDAVLAARAPPATSEKK